MNFRIPWNSCLSDLFYKEWDAILKDAHLIGITLGAIARIYEGLRNSELNVAGLSRIHFISFQAAGYGRGFIENVCRLFPELGHSKIFRNAAIENLHADVSVCEEVVCSSIRELSGRCGCSNCALRLDPDRQYHTCHVAIFGFLRKVTNIMAHTDMKASIDPLRSD